jgi:thiamine pyrophosphate-dependent acetolactate synthase large subunit-like protein
MFIYGERFVCSAIVGGVLAMACGKALMNKIQGNGSHVHCFCGDGATDQGAFWEAIRFAQHRKLPITFIVEDNGGQCGVGWGQRWKEAPEFGWSLPWEIEMIGGGFVKYYQYKPTHPHAGCLGADGKPTRPPIKWPR